LFPNSALLVIERDYGLLQTDFEHEAFLMNGLSILIGFRGFKLHGFVADGAGWKFRSDLASNPRNKSGDFWHGVASDASHQTAQETVAGWARRRDVKKTSKV
jgi:hypothetical protein